MTKDRYLGLAVIVGLVMMIVELWLSPFVQVGFAALVGLISS